MSKALDGSALGPRCGRAGVAGLLPEKIDPSTGAFLGNDPQTFSQVDVVRGLA